MEPFTVGGRSYDETIVIGTSNRESLAVTTAVHATRDEEPELLHSLLETTAETPYVPFSEDHHSKTDADREFYEATIEASADVLSVATKSKAADQTQTHLHAVNAALLLETLVSTPDEVLVLSTVNRTHAEELIKAIGSDACSLSRTPRVAYAPRLWWYYPTAMVGKLASRFLSDVFTAQRIPDIYRNVPIREADGEWHEGDAGRSRSEFRYRPFDRASAYGETEAERLYCWFAGLLPTSDPADRIEPDYDAFRNWTRDAGHERFLSLLRMFR